jgi:hypothetical protein
MIVSNKNQEIKKNRSDQYFSDKIIPSETFLNDPKKALKKLTIVQKRALRHILWLRNKNSIYFSQDWLANKVGCSRKTINETIRELCDLGLIAKFFRMMQTCLYRITDYILNPNDMWKKALLGILIFSVNNLFSISGNFRYVERVTQYNNKKSLCNSNHSFIYSLLVINSHKQKSSNYSSRHREIKKGDKMEEFKKEEFISDIVKSVTNFEMDLEQQFRLSSIPDAALNYAYSNMKSDSDFNSFWRVAFDYCNAHGMKINWRKYYQVCEAFAVKRSRPKYDEGNGRPQKEGSDSVSRYKQYINQLSPNYLELASKNPIEVFNKQYREMLAYEFNWINTEKSWWQMGMINMVAPSFIGYCGGDLVKNCAPKLHPDEVLYKLDLLTRSDVFKSIVDEFGSDVARKFIVICFDSVLSEQNNAKPAPYRIYNKDKISAHQANLSEFLASDQYEYMSSLLGKATLNKYVLEMVSNWIRLVEC